MKYLRKRKMMGKTDTGTKMSWQTIYNTHSPMLSTHRMKIWKWKNLKRENVMKH